MECILFHYKKDCKSGWLIIIHYKSVPYVLLKLLTSFSIPSSNVCLPGRLLDPNLHRMRDLFGRLHGLWGSLNLLLAGHHRPEFKQLWSLCTGVCCMDMHLEGFSIVQFDPLTCLPLSA